MGGGPWSYRRSPRLGWRPAPRRGARSRPVRSRPAKSRPAKSTRGERRRVICGRFFSFRQVHPELRPFFDVQTGKVQGRCAKDLTSPWNRHRRAPSPHSLQVYPSPVHHACHSPRQNPIASARSKTGLGLFATKPIKKGSKIIRYFGPILDFQEKDEDAIENKYLFELNGRWTIDGSIRENLARYINHACRPNAESDRQAAQAQGHHPRHQGHRAGRGDQLRLRHRLLQGLPEANRLQMRRLREESVRRSAPRRGRRKPAAEGKAERKAKKQAEKKAEKLAKPDAKAKTKPSQEQAQR